MGIGELCNRVVIVAGPNTSAAEAARLMRRHHVGNLVITEDGGGGHPVGLVTDRDLVLEVLATDCDPQAVTVSDLMTRTLETVQVDSGFWDALEKMRRHGVRRLPVVDADGQLAGIFTLDDALSLINEATADLVDLVGREIDHEEALRPEQ